MNDENLRFQDIITSPGPKTTPNNPAVCGEMVQTRTRRTMLRSVPTAALALLVAAGFADAEEETRDHLEKFLSAYTGLFHNQGMHDADPSGVLFASKHHIPVTNEFLCPSGGPGSEKYCFFVNENTKRGGSMQYRLRMAVITVKQQGKEEGAEDGGTGNGAGPVVFTATHYKFADQVGQARQILTERGGGEKRESVCVRIEAVVLKSRLAHRRHPSRSFPTKSASAASRKWMAPSSLSSPVAVSTFTSYQVVACLMGSRIFPHLVCFNQPKIAYIFSLPPSLPPSLLLPPSSKFLSCPYPLPSCRFILPAFLHQLLFTHPPIHPSTHP